MVEPMESTKYHFASALTREGWRDGVTVAVDTAGMISSLVTGTQEGLHIKGIAIPAVANVHSHAHQRLMLGLAERAGPGADSFWTWREAMYGFALRLSPDDLQAVAAQAYVEMLKSGYSVVGEFQYLHHQPDGTPYGNPAEMSLSCLAAAEEAGIAMTMLPTLYAYGGFEGQAPVAGQRRFINGSGSFMNIYEALVREAKGHSLCRGWNFAPFAARRDAGITGNRHRWD